MAVSRTCYFLILLSTIMVQETLGSAGSTSWWNLGVTNCGLKRGASCPTCAQFRNNTLTQSQTEKCYSDSIPIEAIAKGSRDAIIDCQLRYNNSKWNCSTFFGQALFGNFIVQHSTRETGVLQAYFAAGAVKGVAEACHDQKIKDCPCSLDGLAESRDAEGNLIYRVCREDFAFALNYVLNFIFDNLRVVVDVVQSVITININIDNVVINLGRQETPMTSSTPSPTPGPTTEAPGSPEETRVLADIHNTVLGFRVVNKTSQECVCHGLSGTCSIQTCYTKVPEVADIGDQLRLKYGGAVKVVNVPNSVSLKNVYAGRDDPGDDDLVYVSESPNFCNPDKSNGVLGTKDRLCVPNGDGPDSCQSLCCDNGHYTRTFKQPNEVCRFVWCCRIECVIEGELDITEHRCNGPRLL